MLISQYAEFYGIPNKHEVGFATVQTFVTTGKQYDSGRKGGSFIFYLTSR